MSRPTDLQAAASGRRVMLVAFLSSFAGTAIVQGSIAGLVAGGHLATVWFPVFTTLYALEDLSAVWVGPWVARRTAGRVLISAELADVCVIAVFFAAATFAPNPIPLLIYLVLSSALPVAVDLAEEMYASDVARVLARKSTLRFNAVLYSAIAIISGIVARPLGAYLGTVTPVGLVTVNLAFTLVALALRITSVRIFPGSGPRALVPPKLSPEPVRTLLRRAVRLDLGRLSPVTSFLLAVSPSVTSAYLVIWAAQGSHNPGLCVFWLLVTTGVGGVLGPQIARLDIGRKLGASMAALSAVAQLIIVVRDTHGSVATADVVLVGCATAAMTAAATCWLTDIASERQVRLSAQEFASLVGSAHSLSALGALIGSWLGFVTRAADDPTKSIFIGFGFWFALTLAVFASPSRDLPANSS